MNFRDYASTETSALVERLTTAAEVAAQTAAQEIRAAADAEIQQVRADAARSGQDAEDLRQQVASLVAETAHLRTQLDAESVRAAEALTQLDAETVRASDALEQLDAAATEAQNAWRANEDLVRDLHAQIEAARAKTHHEAERAGVLEGLLQAAQAAASSHRAETDDANALADGLQSGMSTLRAQRQQVTVLLGESIDAFDALATATTVDELFTKLVQQTAAQFPRVVIFRRKGQRLEGELATGLDPSVDLADVALTMGADSIITTAAAQGVYAYATAEQLGDAHRLPGDVPAFAVAAPLVFQSETLAVLYADTGLAEKGEAHAAFAGVLAAHTNVLLSRLTQELKIARELREYAQMLLHEAEEMFVADTREGRTRPDRLRRLRDTIDFGRQLYAQRAALEGPGAAGLLDEEIATLVGTDPSTDFSDALSDALAQMPVVSAGA
ncbi:MAG: hypothetical protein M3541_09365 [Acidobacteriota bacterium]|nr:hypothetical protein [Acidobacteriota bacterium]